MGCKRRKMVWSGAMNKMVSRCAAYDTKGGLGAFAIPGVDFGQIKDTLITGGVAVGGAVLAGKTVAYLVPLVKIDPASRWLPVLEIGIGIGWGIAVSKITKKPDLGAALAIGPVVVNGLRIVSGILAANNKELSGRPPVSTQEQLGAMQEQGAFPPTFMYDESLAAGFPQEQAAWVM